MTQKKRITIYDIKKAVEASDESKFFAKSNLKYWGQTMKDFKIKKVANNLYFITAPLRNRDMVAGRLEAFYSSEKKRIINYINRFN